MVAQPLPKDGRLVGWHRLTSQQARRRFDGPPGPAEPHPQHSVQPGGGGQRQRLGTPLVAAPDRLGLVERQAQALVGRRHRQHLQRDLGDQPEHAHRADQQAADVIAGHVLHHLAAKAHHLAAGRDQHRAEDEVTHRAGRHPPRPGQPGRHHAADRAARGKMRRFAGQALAMRSQHGLQLGQRRAAAHRHHQLGRFVGNDTSIVPAIDDDRLQRCRVAPGHGPCPPRVAVEILGATAAQPHRPAGPTGRDQLFAQLRQDRLGLGPVIGGTCRCPIARRPCAHAFFAAAALCVHALLLVRHRHPSQALVVLTASLSEARQLGELQPAMLDMHPAIFGAAMQ